MMMNVKRSIIASALVLVSVNVSAGIVTNDTELLGGADHQMLSTMFGQDMDLTRIFAKQTGDTGYDWHATVDGQGATFTVIKIANEGMENMRVGGYNGSSWNSSNDYAVDATNFLFNLDTGIKYLQERHSGTLHSTYNSAANGPRFGAGHDLQVDNKLAGGHANIGYTYGEISRYRKTSYREEFTGTFKSWSIVGMETFTLSSSTGNFGTGAVAKVSAPVALSALAMIGLMGFRRKLSASI
jgi:hypothetical protein